MNDKQYRILIIEPSPIIAEGLKKIISSDSYLIVSISTDASRIDEKIASARADAIIINPSVIELHRRNSIRNITSKRPLIGLITTYTSSDILRQFNATIGILDSETEINEKLSEAFGSTEGEDTPTETSELSDREKEILIAVAKGMMNKEIASLHNISIHTVISHRKNITRKIGIKSVSGLVVYALLNNLIEQHEIQ